MGLYQTSYLMLRKTVNNQLLRSYMGDKADTLRKCSTKILFLLLLHMHFGCYYNLEFPQRTKGEVCRQLKYFKPPGSLCY